MGKYGENFILDYKLLYFLSKSVTYLGVSETFDFYHGHELLLLMVKALSSCSPSYCQSIIVLCGIFSEQQQQHS